MPSDGQEVRCVMSGVKVDYVGAGYEDTPYGRHAYWLARGVDANTMDLPVMDDEDGFVVDLIAILTANRGDG